MKQVFSIMLLSIICGGLGLAGGWFAGIEKGKTSLKESEESHEDHGQPALSALALENMGIVVKPAELSNFYKYETVPATIEELPSATQPIFAPIHGHVEKINVTERELVKQNHVIVELIRDALPRVQLTLTQDILKPATEEFHESLAKFRRSIKNLEILQQELNRIKQFSSDESSGAFPIVPKKRIIETEYSIERNQHELAIYREELARHGLSPKQIELGKLGKFPEIDAQIWNKALKHHGLWPPIADEIYQALPSDIQKLHWTMATIGELVAAGLITKDLVGWLKSKPEIGKYFLEIGGLLQQGSTLTKIRHLYELNAFHPTVKVVAPPFYPDWDVDKIFIKPNQFVKEGELLSNLKNNSDLYLVVKPEGSEKNIILQALQKKMALKAYPLLKEEGPTLENLQLENIISDSAAGTLKGFIKIKNQVLNLNTKASDGQYRTWQLRAKQQYIVQIPIEVLEKVYVFPKDAVTEDGPKKIVFLQNGDNFKPIEVKILYSDHEVIVVSSRSDIFPGDAIVHHGAFALGLALKSDSAQDAGHGHAH